MEIIALERDILLACIQASSFPGGVMAAHEQLHKLFPDTEAGRVFYGLSRPEQGGTIHYYAATEVYSVAEADKIGLKTIELKKGNYFSTIVHDFMLNIPAIGSAFDQILMQPGIDPAGYCVEVYINDKDVQCMVRMTE